MTLCTKDKKVFEFFIRYFEVAKAFAVAGCDVTQGKGAVVADVQAAVSMTSRFRLGDHKAVVRVGETSDDFVELRHVRHMYAGRGLFLKA